MAFHRVINGIVLKWNYSIGDVYTRRHCDLQAITQKKQSPAWWGVATNKASSSDNS